MFQFEISYLTPRLRKGPKQIVETGNDNPETLLNCHSREISIVEDGDDNDANPIGVVKIKPDLIYKNKELVVGLSDTKYKILKVDGKKNKIVGIRSGDIQQLTTYWLHYCEKHLHPPKLSLIYPCPAGAESSADAIVSLGTVNLMLNRLPILKETSIRIQIFGVSIPKLVGLLSTKEKNRKPLSSAAAILLGSPPAKLAA